ncbi:alpha-2-macroglobulin family protein [Barnesiella viscericola]|uniref:alpha-2-macroglobulin family protein n=1 Tax=Barnesiella viscericola TaxID=397865 RepID=UPI0024B6EAFB|nr:alpha-2-macroglobulin family protein [Barnesiella viscericola]
MKKRTWIIVATLFSLGAIVGANALINTTGTDTINQELSAEEQIVAAPKEALDSARIDLDKALAAHDAPAVIASLIKQSAAQLLIDRDSFPAIIARTESLADRSQNVAEQSLLRLISARLYHLYLEDNYQIRLRDEVDDFSQPLETWSANMFSAKIDTLLTQATAPVQELLATPVSAYRQALTIGSDSIFRPTLYDFVVGEAIDLYKRMNRYSPFQTIARQELLVPVQKFTTIVLDDKKQPDGRILQLYAEVLKAHAAEAGSAPLMMWDLQRLEYLGENLYYNSDKESLFSNYIDLLNALLESYRDKPYSVEVASTLASRLWDTDRYDDARRALDLCNQWIAAYPKYRNINNLVNLRNTLTAREAYTSLPSVAYPGESDSVRLSYRNIDTLTLRIYRQPEPLSIAEQNTYYLTPQAWNRDECVYNHDYAIGDTLSLVTRQRGIVFPQLAPGLYVVEMLVDEKAQQSTSYYTVSGVKVITRPATGKQVELIAVDARTGKPLPKAEVVLYQSKSYQGTDATEKARLRTDKNGLCLIDTEDEGFLFAQVSTALDRFAPATRLSSPGLYDRDDNNTRTALFTDRSLYRPGQTLYFSGIRYINSTSESRTVAGERCTVSLLDPSSREVASTEVTTDAYGQFTGSFVIPRGNLLGDYTLRVDQSWSDRLTVAVAEYKLPMFRVEFKPVTEGTSFGKPVTLQGSARSYSGVPQAGASVQYTIYRQANPFFRYYLPSGREEIESRTTTVDASGNFAITFIPQRDSFEGNINREQAYLYQIVATVTAPTGETVEQSTSVQVGDSPYFITVSAPRYLDKFQSAGQIKAQVRTLNGQTVERACRLVFYSLYNDTEGQPLDSLKIKMQVGEVTIGADGRALYPDFTKWASGPYRIVAFSNDESKRIIRSECNFVLYGEKDKQPPCFAEIWLPRTDIIARVGETVKIPVGTSLREGYIFYSIYTPDRLVETHLLKLSNRCKTLSIKFDKSFGDVATISLLIVRNGEMKTAQVTIRQATPDRKLTLKTSTFRDKLLPGNLENWTFSVTDAQGNPVTARFMTEMFDASMQAIRSHNWAFDVPAPIPYARISTQPSTDYHYDRRLQVTVRPDYLSIPTETTTQFLYLNLLDDSSRRFPIFASKAVASGIQINEAEAALDEVVVTKSAAAASPVSGGESSAQPDESIRTSEISTAFFYPSLTTDSLGQISFSFTVPNENTTWQFLALAYTQGLFSGRYEAQTVASKPLMVSPNLPRFVRQGDHVTIATAIQNQSDAPQDGTVRFELFDPYTDRVIQSSQSAFIIDPGNSRTIDYTFAVPEGIELLGFRAQASTLQHSDGEQQILPVLSAKVLVTDSKPFYIPGGEQTVPVVMPGMERKLQSPTVESLRMTLQYCNNPAWYAVQALPALTDLTDNDAISISAVLYANSLASSMARSNPLIVRAIESWQAAGGKNLTSLLAQNEELKQILLSATPWVLEADNETERLQQLATLFDTNRANRLSREAILKLQNLQGSDGGWSWFQGMPASSWVTMNILEGFARLRALGVPLDDSTIHEMQTEAIAFLDRSVERQRRLEPNAPLSYNDICYLLTRSSYQDIPLGQTLGIHQAMMEQLKQWIPLSTIEKAYAAITLQRYGFTDVAREIVASLRQYAVTTPDKGMFWPNNRSSYGYSNSAVQEQCALIAAFTAVDSVTTELDEMRRWLLTQKQTNEWESVPSTLEAIYALLYGGTDLLAADSTQPVIVWGGREMKYSPEEPFLGLTEYTLPGNQVTAADATAVISTNHQQPSWGALYWQYYDDVKNVEAASVNELALDRQILVRQPSGTYVPINTVALKTGDRVAVRLTLTVGQGMQFVCLTDNRAACLEPVDQLSGYTYRERIGYYQEVKNTETRFYFDFLPKGTYVIAYELNVDRPGEYTQGLSTIQCLYAPQIIARTPAQTIIVK